jgi:hypothetical protein
LPPAPLPRTTRSYSSGLVLNVFILCDEELGLISGWKNLRSKKWPLI